MRSLVQEPIIKDRRTGPTVASYRDVRGAALAAHELVERGFAPEEVTVQPAAMTIDRHACRVLMDERRLLARVAIGSAVATFAAVVVTLGVGVGAVIVALLAAGLAAGIGVGVASVMRRRVEARTHQAARIIRAERFDVVVAPQRADEAEHELATWWRPDAPPGGAAIG
jgi:hypothetical protein